MRAPGAARSLVESVLAERVAAPVLECAKLVISELVTNSVRHSGLPAGAGVAFRVGLAGHDLRLEVEDLGCDGVVASRASDSEAVGGFGLQVVDALSERWGSERSPEGGTRVWAELSGFAPDGSPESDRRRERDCAPEAGSTGEVHVVPEPRAATWGVYGDPVAGPLSEHTSETEAESAARAHVRARGTGRIVIHDRYHRTRATVLQHD